MRVCEDCDFLVPPSRTDCQQCGAGYKKLVRYGLAAAAIALALGAGLAAADGEVQGNFSDIYGSALN